MYRLFCLLFYGYVPEWKIINTEPLSYKNDWSSGSCVRYTLQCTHTGNIKTKLAK